MERTRLQRWARPAGVAGTLAIAVGFVLVTGWPAALTPAALAERLEGSGAWGPLLLAALMVLAVVLGPVPTVPITVATGFVYGPVLGTALAAGSALLGAMLAFAIARFAARDLVARLVGGHVALCRECSDRMLFWVVLISRLVPIVSFALVSYGAGLTAMSLRAFAVATLIGMLPMTVVYVSVGSVLVVSPVWAGIAGGVVVVLMLAFPPAFERYAPPRLKRKMPHLRERNAADDC
ncbi:MAG: TVP38/TMEM64 family protein [Rhodospirillales bacterium]|nr:MAG: TVP38/TMEM64 family protein [Rhodospirillales bacterium]